MHQMFVQNSMPNYVYGLKNLLGDVPATGHSVAQLTLFSMDIACFSHMQYHKCGCSYL